MLLVLAAPLLEDTMEPVASIVFTCMFAVVLVAGIVLSCCLCFRAVN